MKPVFKNAVALSVAIATIGLQVAPASFAYAAGYLTLDSFSGTPGSAITASGGGWNAGDTVNVYFSSASGSAAGSATVLTDGTFSAPITVPANAAPGALPVVGVDQTTRESESNGFYVNPLSAAITISAASHAPYSAVTVSGTGFAPNEKVNLALASATAQAQADATGSFTGAVITVPVVTSGLYNLTATGASSGASVPNYTNFFWIDGFYPSISPSSYYLMPGATLSFTGSGFAAGETVTVTADNSSAALSTFTAGADGTFKNAGGFALPSSFSGASHTFTLTGSKSEASASTGMTVGNFYPYASPSSYYLTPGTDLAFTGGGFAANETVNVYQGASTTAVASFTTDEDGSFADAGSVSIPFSAANSVITYNLVGQASKASTSASAGVGSFYPSISPAMYYVVPNATLQISGSGFAANESVSVGITGGASTTAMTDKNGDLSASVLVPFSKTGSATVTATGAQSFATATVGLTMATFYGSVSPYSYFVYPGDMISYMGTGFAPNEKVDVSMTPGTTTTIVADATGSFTTASTTVPFSNMGTLSASFIGELSGATANSTISIGAISPILSSDAYSATQGQTVHVSGSHFASGETVNVTAGSFATTTAADASGNTAAVAIMAPYNASSVTVTFTGASSKASASLPISLQSFNAQLSVDNFYAQPGTAVTASGTGFAPNEQVSVGDGSATSSVAADAFGSFAKSITLPFGKTSEVISAIGQTSGASAAVTVGFSPFSPQISPSDYYAHAGTVETITGSGFAPNESVTVADGTSSTTATADMMGSFTASITLPFNVKNETITATGATSKASASVSVGFAPYSPQVAASTYYTTPGSTIDFSGTGFAPNEKVDVTFNGNAVQSVTASTTGAFTYSYALGYGSTKANFAFAGETTGASQSFSITLAPFMAGIQLSNYYAQSGAPLTITGTSYAPGETVTLKGNGIQFATVDADAMGNFSYSGHVPYSVSGPMAINAVGGTSGAVSSATMIVAPTYVNLQLGAYAGAPGSAITFVGSGYLPGETISIATDRTGSTPVYSFAADATGSFSNSGYVVPNAFMGGTLVLTATGNHSLVPTSITYYVTGQ